jgi:hypothetical protein
VHAAPGQFDGHSDIGAPSSPGTASYDADAQRYVLSAGSGGLSGKRDRLHLVWKKLRGDFIVHARVRFDAPGSAGAQAGWIARAALDADAPYLAAVATADGQASRQSRDRKAGFTTHDRLDLAGADVVELERAGHSLIVRAARFGETFASREVAHLSLPDELVVGLFVTASGSASQSRATFDNVRIIRPATPGFVPYRDYIGSELEVLDVASGTRTTLYRSKDPFEAPNWTRDGKALIVNSSGSKPEVRGRLYRFELATKRRVLIDTGFAIRNNNDHVLSFDGGMLGISDQSQDDHQSVVYTLPASGGTPRRITKLALSYLHGWSPDGKSLVFTGGRGGEFDIYGIAADGSANEVRLTDAKALDDGPEYSPDGRFIYFNSTREGKMQLWRMRPDGSAPERITHDEFNNWFPHFSPDGKWIAMVSYGPEVPPAEHPYYRHVYLRLMPADGGAARVIAYVYGGQGTMNVPSWSPDSGRLAFVSNSD